MLCPNGWIIFDFEDPSGETRWRIDPPAGHCIRAATTRSDLMFFSDETCSDGAACRVVGPNESVVVAGPQLPRGVLGTFETAAIEGGECPLSCD